MQKTVSLPVGVVVRRTPGVTRWATWNWVPVAVLPGAGPANWAELRREGDAVEYHAGTLTMELFRGETEAYLTGLSQSPPQVYVVLRRDDDPESTHDMVLHMVTASPYEAQDYLDSGEEVVEAVPMPAGLIAWIREFVEAHHEDEVFVKRKRDKKRIDLAEDGIGDVRIKQVADVYRAPAAKRRLQ